MKIIQEVAGSEGNRVEKAIGVYLADELFEQRTKSSMVFKYLGIIIGNAIAQMDVEDFLGAVKDIAPEGNGPEVSKAVIQWIYKGLLEGFGSRPTTQWIASGLGNRK